jgi:DNA replication protein DnaC
LDGAELFVQDIVCHDPDKPDKPCPLCDGTGVYTLNVTVDDPRFGKFQRCPNHPVETDHEMQERLRRFGNLDAYRDKTFVSFETDPFGGSYSPKVVDSLAYVKEQAERFAQAPIGWVVYEGPFGCGKTHLAVAIANVRLEQFGEQVVFLTAPDLLDFLRTSFAPSVEATYDEYFERIRNVPFLVLDDLGAENPSAWAKEKLFQLLNYRHVKALPTVITTNTPFDDLDPRISSRMMDPDVVRHFKITAPDYRRTARSQALGMRFNNLQIYHQMTFQSFSADSLFRDEEANLKKAKQLAEEWAKRPAGWLCFMGDFGCGKTHLAASIANDLHERGKDVMFTTVPDLLDYLRLAFDPRSSSRFDKRFHDILSIPILILDDLRLASATPWAKEKLFQVIDYRYLRRMPTVITTSETMDTTDPRFATRLMDRRVCLPFALEVRSYVKRMKTQT